MARQYKLRLRDGTILAVDQAGLRTWLIDDRAMVQPMGTRGWRPLREVLAQESLAAAIQPPPPAPVPRPQTLADADIPDIPIKPATLETPARREATERAVDALVPERLTAPAAAPVPRAPAPAPPPVVRPGASAPAVAKAVAPPAPAPRPPAPPPAVPARPVVATAPAVAPAPRQAPRQAPPPRAAAPPPARAATPLIPEPPPEDAPPLMDDLPIIPFKQLDDEPAPPKMSVRVATPMHTLEESDLADALALVIQKEVAEGHAVVISEDDLEELDLVDDEPPAEGPALPTKEAFEAEVSRSVNQLVGSVQQIMGWARSALTAARATASAARTAAAAPKPAPPMLPPPPLADLRVIPLASFDQKPAASRRRAVLGGLAAAVVLALGGVAAWLWSGRTQAAPSVPRAVEATPLPAPTPPPLPNDVVLASERMPHLAPETVQLLISTSPFASPEAGDLFRRGRQALRRGVVALTPEETHELAVLERAMLVRLGPSERERVMAYDRMRAGRDLVPAEDARVLSLVARGARGLPAEHRLRLQALSGKAIAAALVAQPSASSSAQ